MGGLSEISRRDWFAGQALQALIAAHPPISLERDQRSGPFELLPADVTAYTAAAYKIADAMVKFGMIDKI